MQAAPKLTKAARTKHATRAQVIEAEPIPYQGITIEFLYSSSSSFGFAVEAARALPGFKQLGEEKKAVYRVTFSMEHMDAALELVEYLKG